MRSLHTTLRRWCSQNFEVRVRACVRPTSESFEKVPGLLSGHSECSTSHASRECCCTTSKCQTTRHQTTLHVSLHHCDQGAAGREPYPYIYNATTICSCQLNQECSWFSFLLLARTRIILNHLSECGSHKTSHNAHVSAQPSTQPASTR